MAISVAAPIVTIEEVSVPSPVFHEELPEIEAENAEEKEEEEAEAEAEAKETVSVLVLDDNEQSKAEEVESAPKHSIKEEHSSKFETLSDLKDDLPAFKLHNPESEFESESESEANTDDFKGSLDEFDEESEIIKAHAAFDTFTSQDSAIESNDTEVKGDPDLNECEMKKNDEDSDMKEKSKEFEMMENDEDSDMKEKAEVSTELEEFAETCDMVDEIKSESNYDINPKINRDINLEINEINRDIKSEINEIESEINLEIDEIKSDIKPDYTVIKESLISEPTVISNPFGFGFTATTSNFAFSSHQFRSVSSPLDKLCNLTATNSNPIKGASFGSSSAILSSSSYLPTSPMNKTFSIKSPNSENGEREARSPSSIQSIIVDDKHEDFSAF